MSEGSKQERIFFSIMALVSLWALTMLISLGMAPTHIILTGSCLGALATFTILSFPKKGTRNNQKHD